MFNRFVLAFCPPIRRLKEQRDRLLSEFGDIREQHMSLSERLAGLEGRLHHFMKSRADFTIPYWYEWNYWEPSVMIALRDLCRPGDTVFDVGANAGALSLEMSRLVGPKGCVFSFEASARIIDKTVYNLSVNGCGNVQVFQKAVYERSGETVEIFEGSHLNDSLKRNETGRAGMRVETVALDDFVAHWGTIPSLVKMDIEGAEYDAVQGFRKTINAHKPHLILEQSPSDMRCHDILKREGYRAIDLSNYVEIVTAQDFPAEAAVSNILFVHSKKIERLPFSMPPRRNHVRTLTGSDLETGIHLDAGRYVFDLAMEAERSDNELIMGLKSMADPLMRYHANSQFLARSYSIWPLRLEKPATVVPYFDFQSGTEDPTFQVKKIEVLHVC